MKTTKDKRLLILTSLIMGLVVLTAFGCAGLSRIEVDAQTNFPEMGGRRPMAHHTIYLLSNSIASPEMEEAFKKHMASTTPPGKPGIPLKESEIRTRAGFMISDGRAIWHKYIIETASTDFEGKTTFRKVSPGDYWLYSITKRPGGQWLLWNVKVTVNFYDTTKVSLSNDNISFN